LVLICFLFSSNLEKLQTESKRLCNNNKDWRDWAGIGGLRKAFMFLNYWYSYNRIYRIKCNVRAV